MGKEHYALGDLKAQNISVPFTCLYNCLGMGALYLLQSAAGLGAHIIPTPEQLFASAYLHHRLCPLPALAKNLNGTPEIMPCHVNTSDRPSPQVPVFVVQLRARYYFTSDLVRLGGNR